MSDQLQGDTTTDDASPAVRFLIDFVPLLVFFAAYFLTGIFWATGIFMAAIAASMVASKKLRGHIPKMLWFTAAIVLVFGALTIFLQDERFIKIKPTLVYSLFAGILAVGLARGKSYLQVVMEAGFPPMRREGWMAMTRNWMIFFVAMAALNEVIWRNFDTDTWVTIKTFGFIPVFFLFAIAQTPILLKHQIEDEEEKDAPGE